MCDFSRYYFQVLVHMQITIYLVIVRVKYSFISGLLFSPDRKTNLFLNSRVYISTSHWVTLYPTASFLKIKWSFPPLFQPITDFWFFCSDHNKIWLITPWFMGCPHNPLILTYAYTSYDPTTTEIIPLNHKQMKLSCWVIRGAT